MKKETKDLLVSMIESWNKFNPQKAVDAYFSNDEFKPLWGSIEIAFDSVAGSDFIGFILPVIMTHKCIWFMNACGSRLIFHIQ